MKRSAVWLLCIVIYAMGPFDNADKVFTWKFVVAMLGFVAIQILIGKQK